MDLSGAVRMARPTACITSMGLLRDSRNATELSEGESVPSPKMPTLMMPWGLRCGGRRQAARAILPLGDVVCGVQVFQGVGCGRLASGVLVEPALEPVPHQEVARRSRRQVLGLVHGIHEGDARLDGNAAVLRVHSGAAHGQRKGKAAEKVGGGEPVASLALGDCSKLDWRRRRRLGH